MVHQSSIRLPSLLRQQKISCSQIGEWPVPREKSLGILGLLSHVRYTYYMWNRCANIKLKTNFYNYIVSKGNISNFLPMKLEGKLLSVSICNNIDIWMGRVMRQTLACHVLYPQIWLVHLQTNQPIKYVYLILCQLRSGCPRSVGHLDWQMPSKQGSHIQQTSADSHTLQRERWIIFHLVDLAPEPEYTIYQTALMHEWTMNHNSLKKKAAIQCHPLCRTHFRQYQASPAVLRWRGMGAAILCKICRQAHTFRL